MGLRHEFWRVGCAALLLAGSGVVGCSKTDSADSRRLEYLQAAEEVKAEEKRLEELKSLAEAARSDFLHKAEEIRLRLIELGTQQMAELTRLQDDGRNFDTASAEAEAMFKPRREAVKREADGIQKQIEVVGADFTNRITAQADRVAQARERRDSLKSSN